VFLLLASAYLIWPTYKIYSLSEDEKTELGVSVMKELKEGAINLGLDLQGGMYVLLETDIPTLVEKLAAKSPIELQDAILELNHLFSGIEVACRDACDSNDDGALTLTDPIFLLHYLIGMGSPPPAPGQECGSDPSVDDLGCTNSDVCGPPNVPPPNDNGNVPPSAPVASFTVSPTSGDYPLLVAFSDTSTGEITEWSWDFGDGGTSTEQHPSHTYNIAGIYTVTLIVSNTGGSDLETCVGCITVTDAPPEGDGGNPPPSGAVGDGFHYTGTDFTIAYDQATGIGVGETTIYLEEGQQNITEPTPLSALSFVLDGGLYLVPVPGSVTEGAGLLAVNGGNGVDVISLSVQDGVAIVNILISFDPNTAILLAPGPVEMFQLDFETIPGTLAGNGFEIQSALIWTTSGTSANEVLPINAAAAIVPTLQDITVTLSPASGP